MLDGSEIYAEGHLVVYLNGNVLGLTRSGPRFVSQFRLLRRAGKISEFVSIYTNEQQQAVHIASDGGRICRPMIIVENGRSRVKEVHMQVNPPPVSNLRALRSDELSHSFCGTRR